jgi:hypothetical protein
MKKDILNETFNKHTFLLKKRLYEQGVIQQQPIQEENLDEDLKSIVTAGLLGLSSLFSKDKPTNNVTSTGTQTTAVATNPYGYGNPYGESGISKDDLKKFSNLTYRSGIAIANCWIDFIKISKEKGTPIPSLVNAEDLKHEDAAAMAGMNLQVEYLRDWIKGKAGSIEEVSLLRLLNNSLEYPRDSDGNIPDGSNPARSVFGKFEDSALDKELDEITEEIITKIIKIKYPNFKPGNRNEDTDKVATAVRNLKNYSIYHQSDRAGSGTYSRQMAK